MKLLFAPFRIVSARLAGLTARKTTAGLWGLIDKREAPKPEERQAGWPRLAASLLIEGAIFRLLSGIADHAARQGFARLTGRWPGKDVSEQE